MGNINSEDLYNQYMNGGLIIRTNDGQTPSGIEDLQDYITNQWAPVNQDEKGPNFFNLIQNTAPAYSSTILGFGASENPCPPIVWYNSDYSQAKDAKGNPLDIKKYGKVMIALALDPMKVSIAGATCFDADSNLRNLGTIPNNIRNDKLTTLSLFDLYGTFGQVCNEEGCAGKWGNPTPASQNNNPLINPLLGPDVKDPYGHATDTNKDKTLSKFLKDVCTTKGIWWTRLFDQNKFISDDAASFIDCLNTGVEIEAETYPDFKLASNQGNPNFSDLKFDKSSFSAVVIFRERGFPSLPQNFVSDYVGPFLKTAAGKGGWVTPFDLEDQLSSFQVVEITGAWMPEVPLEGTSSSGDPLSNQIPAIAAKGKRFLSQNDFQILSYDKE